MKKILILSLTVCLSFLAKSEEKPLLVTPQWVMEHMHDPNVVFVQVSYSKYDYDNEHIAGARYLWPEWLAPNTPEVNYNVPDPRTASRILQGMGISEGSHVVLCHIRNEVSVTARMFLTLEHLGLKGRVSYLNGGLEAWKKEGYAVTRDVPAIKKGNFKVRPGNLVVDRNYVLGLLRSDKGFVVDARATRYFDGEPTGYPRAGHIAGAKNIQYTDMVDELNLFKPADQLKGYFSSFASPDKELVTYCFIGQTASVVYMAGRILGYDMKLYDGSMQEWSRFDDLPMETTQQ